MPGERNVLYSYTGTNFVEKIEDNIGNYILFSYDSEGNRIREEIQDNAGVLRKFTDFEYDAYGRLIETTYPGNVSENRGYDLKGKLISLTDANGNLTTYAYDDLDRLISVIQPGSIVTGS